MRHGLFCSVDLSHKYPALPVQGTYARGLVSKTRHAPPSISERNARLIALLDSFDDGDPEQQCQDFDVLQAGLEAARLGQHCLLGLCVNP